MIADGKQVIDWGRRETSRLQRNLATAGLLLFVSTIAAMALLGSCTS